MSGVAGQFQVRKGGSGDGVVRLGGAGLCLPRPSQRGSS